MKRLSSVLWCLSLLVVPMAAHAQATAWAGFAAGMSVPLGSFAHRADRAVDLGLSYVYPIGESWSAGVDLYNHQWGGKGLVPRPDQVVGNVAVDNYRVSQVSALLYWVPELRGTVQPYLRVGPGFYQLRTSYVANAFPSETADHFGVLAGGGLVFRLQERVGLSTDAVFHHVLARDNRSAMDAVSLTAGLILRFGL